MGVFDPHVAKGDGFDFGAHTVSCPVKPFSMTSTKSIVVKVHLE